MAFLKAKNLTDQEIDLAFQRASTEPPQDDRPNAPYQQRSSPYNAPYNYGQPWQQAPPPELPRRDWRDWFIMATVVGGVGYGALTLAKRYVYPLIAPPTPPQIVQDKAQIDAAFERTFSLLNQVVADTQQLKDSEQARTERLDAALANVESVVSKMKDAGRARDAENARIANDITNLKDLIPRAIKAQEDSADARLQELHTEMKSLKTLLANRIASSKNTTPPAYTTTPGGDATQTSQSSPDQASSSSPYAKNAGAGASIPAWQMAASGVDKSLNPAASPSNATTEIASH